ncbi:hypothetical protein EVAR_39952_1 [Eumeta japonica]|uniref:Uncharacterized protein n=1 Tax=Eumeta variegata TaxID=151549 RepID=A0A4C1X2C5_EUMVA|nr:hypothetical protein EVAR_39952_1 [Eumeta japonica]
MRTKVLIGDAFDKPSTMKDVRTPVVGPVCGSMARLRTIHLRIPDSVSSAVIGSADDCQHFKEANELVSRRIVGGRRRLRTLTTLKRSLVRCRTQARKEYLMEGGGVMDPLEPLLDEVNKGSRYFTFVLWASPRAPARPCGEGPAGTDGTIQIARDFGLSRYSGSSGRRDFDGHVKSVFRRTGRRVVTDASGKRPRPGCGTTTASTMAGNQCIS